MTFLDRYQQGEYVAVWAEITAMGEGVQARKIRDDARAVAMETMRRARQNLQTTAANFRPPPRRMPDTLKALEKQLRGKLPLSLHAWWLHVGEVAHLDLIVFPFNTASLFKPPPPFFPPRRAWETSIEAWRRTLRAEGLTPEQAEAKLAPAIAEFEAQDEEYDILAEIPFDPRIRHPLMPDPLAKAGVKDGTWNVLLPQFTADFPLENADGEMLFVPYLRHFFQSLPVAGLLAL